MRFRFTIRDLFWMTLVVAMAVGWWLDHRSQRFSVYTLQDGRHAVLDRETGRHRLILDEFPF